jgi:hypothetical protein
MKRQLYLSDPNELTIFLMRHMIAINDSSAEEYSAAWNASGTRPFLS